MHIRNLHKDRYNLTELSEVSPELREFIFVNPYGDETVDFANPLAVKALNRALLKKFYGIKWWDIPEAYLCPPIPGRADYLHHVADLLGNNRYKLSVLDVGVGANCVYPIIGHAEYEWNFVGSDIDEVALESAKKIIEANDLGKFVELRHQKDPKKIFQSIIKPTDRFDIVICNPPFHSSAEEAQAGSQRKQTNLGLKKDVLNFGGQSHELWCQGGEVSFVSQMIEESIGYKNQVGWFTTLIAKKEHLPALKARLDKMGVSKTKIVEMKQGQKISRILAWTYFKGSH